MSSACSKQVVKEYERAVIFRLGRLIGGLLLDEMTLFPNSSLRRDAFSSPLPSRAKISREEQLMRDYDHKFLHMKVALVGQELVLYGRLVEENIGYGYQNTTPEAVQRSAKHANAHGFIMDTQQGYETDVGEKGGQMSGGQKQRIAIARALVREPVVLLLDEATSALDSESEHLVQEAIQKNLKGRTVLLIAHRLSTVKNADKIVVSRRRGRRLLLPEASSAGAALLLHPLPINCCFFVASLYASQAATSTICELGKRTCSRLRPNFLAVCQPRNLSALCPPDKFTYISDYECTSKMFDQNEYFSFPSGHSAAVCNFAVFLIHYLQKRFKLSPSLRSFAQFFIVLFAYFVCLSRVRDHKHRLTDVAGGALVGDLFPEKCAPQLSAQPLLRHGHRHGRGKGERATTRGQHSMVEEAKPTKETLKLVEISSHVYEQ